MPIFEHLTTRAFHHTMYCMDMHTSMERELHRAEDGAGRQELIKRFNDWALEITGGAELPVGWFLPYNDNKLREAWEQDDQARREFVLQIYRSLGQVAPYDWVRNSDEPALDRYEGK